MTVCIVQPKSRSAMAERARTLFMGRCSLTWFIVMVDGLLCAVMV